MSQCNFFWASCSNHCSAALDLGADVEQPFDCLIVQNRQAMQSMRRSMDWTLEDNMVDGCYSEPHSQVAEEAKPHLYKQERKRPIPVRRRLSRTHQALLGRAIPGCVCREWKCGGLCPPTPHSIGNPPTALHVCCCCQINWWDVVQRVQMSVSIWGALHLYSMDGWALATIDRWALAIATKLAKACQYLWNVDKEKENFAARNFDQIQNRFGLSGGRICNCVTTATQYCYELRKWRSPLFHRTNGHWALIVIICIAAIPSLFLTCVHIFAHQKIFLPLFLTFVYIFTLSSGQRFPTAERRCSAALFCDKEL